MLVPKFAFVCCCCCTHAVLVKKFPSIGSTVHHHGVENVLAEAIEDARIRRAEDIANQPSDDFIGNDSTVGGANGSKHQENLNSHSENNPSNQSNTANDDYDFHDHNLVIDGHGRVVDDHDDHDHDDNSTVTWSEAQSYGYGTLANFIITLTSLSGIFIILYVEKCSTGTNYYIFDFFITLAASTMLGDAFFHILPKVLGLHGHGAGDDDGHEDGHDDVDDHDDSEYFNALGKIGVIISVMYAFWVFETLVCLLGGAEHSHSHTPMQHHTHAAEPMSNISESGDETNDNKSAEEKVNIKWNTVIGILVGDVLHNFVDGIAIGVSWAVGWSTGLASSIAILLHELPHELGDFVIYKKLGLSNAQSLGANLFAALTSFGGLYLGLSLAHETDASIWLLACVTGLFIYVALVDIVSTINTCLR